MTATRTPRVARSGLLPCSLFLLSMLAPAAVAGPYIWDQDTDDIDDRIESVQLLGYRFSFENGDTLARQRIEVTRALGDLAYGVYVLYDHDPTSADLDSLSLIGMPTLFRYEGAPAVRSAATFLQIQFAVKLQHVERIEAIPILSPELPEDALAIGA